MSIRPLPPKATEPLAVRAPFGGTVVEIDWGDGHTGRIPNRRLRGFCPCAGCQGHEPTIRYVEGGNDVIDAISEVGNYGLSFRWGDGHETGIYRFEYLRRLCACDACLPAWDSQRG